MERGNSYPNDRIYLLNMVYLDQDLNQATAYRRYETTVTVERLKLGFLCTGDAVEGFRNYNMNFNFC